GDGYAVIGLTLEARLSRVVSIRPGFGVDFPGESRIPDDIMANANTRTSGVSFDVAFPLRLYSAQRHELALTPQLGVIRHSFRYFRPDNSFTQLASFSVNQARLGIAFEYSYLPPPAERQTPLGFATQLGVSQFSSTGGYTGQPAYFLKFGLLLM